jgi:hypothetical protein
MIPRDKNRAKKLAESPEMARYYHVLAVKHSNSLRRVMRRGINAEDTIEAAQKETELLLETERFIESAPGNQNHKCKPGTIWDEELDKCVPI